MRSSGLEFGLHFFDGDEHHCQRFDGKELALHRHDDFVGCDEAINREKTERWGRSMRMKS